MKAKYTAYWTWIVLLGFGLWTLAVPRNAHADVYHGTVVDAESGEPLADAALVVVWWTRPYLRIGGTQYFHDAKETVTDSQGKFSLDVSPAINWNPFMYIHERPTILIYKPGYRPATSGTAPSPGFPKFPNPIEALKKGVTVELPKLTTQEEARRYVSASIIGTDVPRELTPNLIRLLNIQSKMAGLTSFYPEPKKGE